MVEVEQATGRLLPNLDAITAIDKNGRMFLEDNSHASGTSESADPP